MYIYIIFKQISIFYEYIYIIKIYFMLDLEGFRVRFNIIYTLHIIH
jgi:hypothetical protein